MKLHEYQGKELLKRFGVNVPDGRVAYTPDEARVIAQEIGAPVMVKAQVHVGGRGKAGGVKYCPTPDVAFEKASDILGMDIKGLTVKKVLVTRAVDIAKEYYVGMIVDRNVQTYTLMVSKEGGVEIEEVAAENPDAIIKFTVDPVSGLRPFEARAVALQAGLEGNLNKIATMMVQLSRACIESDATLAEINPLVITEQGDVVAADAKVDLDDNALFRHQDLLHYRELEAEHPLEVEASNYGFAYVKLDGHIGVIGNGAGIVMTSLDVVNRVGGKPANFLDIGGGAKAEVVYNAVKLVLKDSDVKGILINIFGGITRADEVAKGVIRALDEGLLTKPVAMRVAGTAEEEAKALLSQLSTPLIKMYPDMFAAAQAVSDEVKA
ncbi:succinyl-CoA synthetase beta subunit [Deinobacterium chartae]|uniref:Succinate--CoA ligase [ADP-forming] subunit beta n=1 Tax=Deinobacterium chartae TaxID=521158 RepID=A0A841HV11_9DEIO|nr:ADP-forming succinate--CoA ligase subunit beta [Deinobacterium chartae]MBB6096663.1 succinyl-CoA synthetase beta subunit [Deinobacterium chartae]